MKKTLIVLYILCCSQLFSQNNEQSLLWEISGNGLEKNSYLYGTMHVSKKVAFRLDDVFFKALNESESIALESDPTTWLEHNYEESLTQNSRQNNSNYNGGFYESKFAFSHPKKGIIRNAIRFDNFLINGFLYRKDAGTDDFEEDTYLDMFIFQAGKKNNKPIHALENLSEARYLTTKASYNAFKKEPDAWFVKLMETRNPYLLQEDVYRDRDINLLDSIGTAVNTEYYRKHMLYKRNHNMVVVLDSLMQEKTVFAGVGAAHLPGKNGMINMLKNKGYTVNALISNQSDIAETEKTKLESLFTKPRLQTESTPDGFITIDCFDKLREFVYGSQKYYITPDMVNGSFLSISRIHTYEYLPNKETITLDDISNLLYEDIPGEILKKETLTNPFPGISILNKTKRGDYQKYHIYKTPLEIVVIKFGGKKDFILDFEEAIFSSIIFNTKNENFTTLNSKFNNYQFSFPESYSSYNTNSSGKKIYQAQKDTDFYFLKEVPIQDVKYIEEDKFEAEYIHDAFYKKYELEKFEGEFENSKYANYKSQAVSDSIANTSIYLKSIVKDENYYLLGYSGTSKDKAETYFKSFQFNEAKYENFKTVVDTTLHFSVKTNTKAPISYNYSYSNNKKDKAFEESEKKTSYTSKSNEVIYIKRKKYNDMQMYNNIDSLWKRTDRYANKSFTKTNEKKTSNNSVYTQSYYLKDSASSKAIRVKNILKKGVLFQLKTLEDTIAKPSKFVHSFFETFAPKDTLLGEDIFTDKTNLLFDALRKDDSLVFKAYDKVIYNESHADSLISILQTFKFPENKLDIKYTFVDELGKLKSDKIKSFFKRLYIQSYSEPEIQTSILNALLNSNKQGSYDLFLQLLEKDFPLNSSHVNSIFYTQKDSLALRKTLFPDILKYTTISEYKKPVYRILVKLKDSSLIQPSYYEKYLTQLVYDAKIEVKRNISDKSAYSYRSNSGTGLQNYVKLLFPYRKNEITTDFFTKLLECEDESALTTYYVLLAKNKENIPNKLKTKTILELEHLATVIEKLEEKEILDDAIDTIINQDAYAKAKLFSSSTYDKETDKIKFISKKEITNEDGLISVYFYKRTRNSSYDGKLEYLQYIAFKKDDKKLITKAYFKQYGTGNKISTLKDQDKLIEEAIEKITYKNRKRISNSRSKYDY